MKASRRTPSQYLFAVAHAAIKNGESRDVFVAQFRPSSREAAGRHYDHLIEDDRAKARRAPKREG